MNLEDVLDVFSDEVKAVIFDMDGTLLDSMGVWDHLSRDVLISLGKQPEPDMEEKIQKMSSKEIAEYMCYNYQLRCTPKDIMKMVYNTVYNKYKYTVQPKPFVRRYTKLLFRQRIPMCVATVTSKTLALCAFDRLHMLGRFEFVLTSDDVGCGKSSPLIYQEAARRLGLPANKIMVFEDTLTAVKTAKESGFQVCAIYDAKSDKDQYQIKRYCDLYIHSFQELVEPLSSIAMELPEF